jgi:hypothetical protein
VHPEELFLAAGTVFTAFADDAVDMSDAQQAGLYAAIGSTASLRLP